MDVCTLNGCNVSDNFDSECYNDSETAKYFGDNFWDLMNNSCGDIELTMEAICFIDYLLANTGGKICDLMCGNARHILGLKQLGYAVTGIDINQNILDSVKELSIFDSTVKLIHANLKNYVFAEKYDCFTLLTSSLGYYGKTEDIRLLEKAYKNLNENGFLILDVPNISDVEINFKQRDWHNVGNKYYLFNSKIISNVKYNNMKVFNDGIADDYYLKMQLYTVEELENRLKKIGFKDVKVYGDFCFQPLVSYDNIRRIQLVSIK